MDDQKSPRTSSKCGPARDDVAPTFRRFVYRGNAVGAAGRITRVDPLNGLDHVLPVQAASSLPATGGRSESVVDRPYSFRITVPAPRELFYVGGARTRAEGYYDSERKVWRTIVRSHVHDVHLLGGRIAIETIVAELSKTHALNEDFPRITPSARCAIRGMSLDGFPVGVDLNLESFRLAPTREALRKRVDKDEKLCRSAHLAKECPTPKEIEEYDIIADIRLPRERLPDVDLDPLQHNCIHWKGVGRIYLGELLVSDISRRLTMFRVRLGCPVEGEFAAGEVEGNGHTLP